MSYAPHMPERGAFLAWRKAARLLISHRIPPDEIDWSGRPTLFASHDLPPHAGSHAVHVPRDFLKLAESVIWHSDIDRFSLLYQALWRLASQDGHPLSQADALGRRLTLLARAVGRDIHKMHAFVRFHELPSQGRRRFAAWFEPEHHTLEPASPFFTKRFADMDWVIATPRLTARFEEGRISFDAGGTRPSLPSGASEALWATYFANIFNPARIKIDAMRSEMPRKYWKNLPETTLIPAMLAGAEERVARMHQAGASKPRPGAKPISTRYRNAMPQQSDGPETMHQARQSAAFCRRCGLCEAASQTIWGKGPVGAELMIVGEQPGDREDLSGSPFVEDVGAALHEAMRDAGLDPERVYLTYAVKHFKFTPQGAQRIPLPPNREETLQCRWWLDMELAFVQPRLVLALGPTAAWALTDDDEALERRHGTIEPGRHGGPVMIARAPVPYRAGGMKNDVKISVFRKALDDVLKRLTESLYPPGQPSE